MSNKKAIFLGAGDGGDIEMFFEEYGEGWDVYAIEAHPTRTSRIRKKFSSDKVTVMQVAASTEEGTMSLYLGPNLNNSSLNRSKINCDRGEILVPTINFTKWMKETCSTEDQILLVMDIEGGEYPILDKMKTEGLFDWINEFYMEFHGRKLAGFDMQIELDWIEYLKEKFQERVYICKVYQHDKFKLLNSEER